MSEESERQQRIDRALRCIVGADVPEGMEMRLGRKLQILRAQAGARCRRSQYALWAGCASAAAVVVVAISVSLVPRNAHQKTGAAVRVEKQAFVSRNASVQNRLPSMHPAVRNRVASRAIAAVSDERFRQAPPLPLTSQELMLIALASRPAVAVAVATSESVTDHGLGENALFELDHELLPPMLSSALEPSSISPSPSQLNSSGENP